MDRSSSLGLAALIALTALIYAPLRHAPFVYEDDQYLRVLDEPIQWSVPSRELTRATWQWQSADYADPSRLHVMNLGLHLVNGVLVYALGAALVGTGAGMGAAAIFLVHPLNSEAVSYLSARTDLLMTLCTLVALVIALRVESVWRWPFVGLVMVAAGMSKEMGIVALPLLLLTVAAFRWKTVNLSAPNVAVFWVGLGLIVGWYLPKIVAWWAIEPSHGGSDMPWATFASYQGAGLAQLLSLIVWPVGLSIDRDPIALGPGWFLIAALLLTQACALVLATWQRYPLIAWAIGWMALTVLPRLLVPTNEWIAERHLYLGMVGIAIGGGALLAAAWRGVKERDVSVVPVSPG